MLNILSRYIGLCYNGTRQYKFFWIKSDYIIKGDIITADAYVSCIASSPAAMELFIWNR